MSEIEVIKLVSSYKNANTFIIGVNENDILIIDLGNYPTDELVNWLNLNNKIVIGLFLTHEHADHCYGIDKLKSKIDFTLYCSEKCEVNMRNPKHNFSRYIEDFETFGVESEAVIIKDGQELDFNGFKLTVMETPGHSPGSICLFSENIVFTGDTLLNNVESPISFPHSNKADYQRSKKRIFESLKPNTKIYPGHDEPFFINN
jgi:glyoxylase-like metal-dependent hydrolase (beta-lactamase superfamily II)